MVAVLGIDAAHKSANRIPWYWKPKEDLDADSFAFELLHNSDSRDQGFPRKIGADAWFENWAAEKYEITEQSFRVSGEGVITILNLDGNVIP